MKPTIALLTGAVFALAALPAAAQDAAAGKEKSAACAACHGEDGNPAVPMFPILAGQTPRYLYLQLKDFKEGRRKNDLMSPMAANLTKQDMQDLAAYYSKQKIKPNGFKADGAKVVRGKKVNDDALCPMCHLGGFSGQNEVPRVAGQHFDYVLAQLKAFKNRERTNDAGNMQGVVRTLPDEDLEALAHYIANLN
jgi:cytochrome c553